MSKYTTGEIAKLCNVTVRTVQYYDTRGILVPSEISDGKRRLYSEEDLNKMKIICFLRDLGLSIDSISKLFNEKNPENVISILIRQQEETLKEEIKNNKEKINKLESLKKEIKSIDNFSIESINGIVYSMENRKKIYKIRVLLITVDVLMSTLQWTAFILWMLQGWWWLLIIALVVTIPCMIWISKYYYAKVAYICPNCQTMFQPKLKEAYFAKYTQTTRKLTCTSCGYNGFCVETCKCE